MNLRLFAFPATFSPDQDGGFVVTFSDLPEAITQGDSIEQCLSEASDCLAEAIAARIDDNLDLPLPSQTTQQQYLIPVPLEIGWKAEVYSLMQKTGVTASVLASWLDVDKDKVRRLISPKYTVDETFAKKALNTILTKLELAESK